MITKPATRPVSLRWQNYMRNCMQKHILAVGGLAAVLLFAGCGQSPTSTGNDNTDTTVSSGVNDAKDTVFSDTNTKVTFHYTGYLLKGTVASAPGSVAVTFTKRPGSSGLIDSLHFSTKTKAASQAEAADAKAKNPKLMCDSVEQYGCEKWDEAYATYQKAVKSGDYAGYYAQGASKVVVNGVTYVVTVTYNIDEQQFETTYTGYSNDTRITFVDPTSGGIEYGIPFSMNAKNRDQVEQLAKDIANRQKIADVKTRARADELYTIVSSVQLAK